MGLNLKNPLQFFKSRTRTSKDRAVGIDIGSSAIKVVELRKLNNTISLSTYGEVQVGPYVEQPMSAVVKLDLPVASQALSDVVGEAGITADIAVLSVPLAASFLTTISLHTNGEEDVANKIPVEARKYIPIPLKEVALDWFEIDQKYNKETNEATHNILMAAIQNESLLNFQRQLGAIEKNDHIMEIEAFSAIRAAAKQDTVLAILDLGASMSKLYIIKGSILQKIHRVKTGAEQITKHLSELKQVSFAEAETIKRSFATDPIHEKDIKNAMAAAYNRPMQEFKRVIQQYNLESGHAVSEIVLIGGGAQLNQVTTFINEVFALPAKKHNPFNKVAYPAFMEDVLVDLGPSFSVALGAAYRALIE